MKARYNDVVNSGGGSWHQLHDINYAISSISILQTVTLAKAGSGKYVVIIKLCPTTRIIMMSKIPDSTNVVI